MFVNMAFFPYPLSLRDVVRNASPIIFVSILPHAPDLELTLVLPLPLLLSVCVTLIISRI